MKILIIRLSSLGDIILTQPAVDWLREKYPDAELHFLTKEQFRDIPFFFIPLTSNNRHSCEGRNPENVQFKVITYHKTLDFHQSLTANYYDIVIDLQAKFSSWLIRWFTPSAKHCTYQKQHLLRRAIITHKTDKAIASTVGLYFSALQGLTNDTNPIQQDTYPCLYIDRSDSTCLTSLLLPTQNKIIIALFPGAAHRTKMYPPQLFIRFLEQLSDRYQVVLLGSKKEYAICQMIHLALPQKTINLAGEFSLMQLIYAIGKADIVITNDSGPMHIAAALSKPQIALYGSTHPRLGFAPLNPQAKVICKNLPCQPCSLHGQETCPLKHFACMLSIKPEEILEAVRALESA